MSNKIYTSVPVPKFPRNVFSLSRPVVGSMRMQRLYPTEILEIFPGDAFNMRQETFLRTAPLVAPPLAKITLSHHAFFVPDWQLHEKFDEFITGGEKMDFTDHMPYTHVGDLYTWITACLTGIKWALTSKTNFGDSPGVFTTSQLMENVISLIEMLDYSRAVPFSLPEFLPLQGENQSGELVTIDELSVSDFDDDSQLVDQILSVATGNLNSWIDYNPVALAASELRVNLLPFYAYLKVWCEYFRDENLVDDFWDVLKESDFWTSTDYQSQMHPSIGYDDYPSAWTNDDLDNWSAIVEFFCLKKRAWKKDRFTSALPWTQKGPDVVIPLSGSIPVEITQGDPKPNSSAQLLVSGTSSNIYYSSQSGSVKLSGSGDLSSASNMATMRDLRRAEAVEEFEEADGRFGNRYPENTLGQFGVFTPDSRLPRAQFLGSTKQVVSFGEIPQTSETGSTPLGTLAGKGTSYSPNFLFKKRFTMHGFVIVLTSIQVSAMYEQGIHPMFSRFDRTEYAWPRYARLGEEPIYAKELSIFGEDVQEDSVFGYAPRYSTYKSDTGSIHGQMKTTLSYWTFSRKFPLDKDPVLSKEFIYNDPRCDAFALTNPYAECFYFEIDWKVRASRLLPFYGVPSI